MPASTLDGLRVVVAEDDFLIAQYLEDLLRDGGASPFMVSSVSELLAIDPKEADVAILDNHLRDGEAAPGAERLAEAGVPLIYQSGRERQELGELAGALAVLPKPIDEQRLLSLLESIRLPAA